MVLSASCMLNRGNGKWRQWVWKLRMGFKEMLRIKMVTPDNRSKWQKSERQKGQHVYFIMQDKRLHHVWLTSWSILVGVSFYVLWDAPDLEEMSSGSSGRNNPDGKHMTSCPIRCGIHGNRRSEIRLAQRCVSQHSSQTMRQRDTWLS